jgi:GlpG protein
MITAAEIPRDVDLSLFSRFLYQSGIQHRISEAGDYQVIRVLHESDSIRVNKLYSEFSSGVFTLEENKLKPVKTESVFVKQLLRSPLTVIMILANAICFPITMGVEQGDFSSWFHTFSFVDFEVISRTTVFVDFSETLRSHQYWRLVTPMFLHFGWLHIVFNSLWTWEIGRRIEVVNGASVLLLIVLVSSVSANVLQYWLTGPGFFGGMSGVVYGLLGFCLSWSKLLPDRDQGVHKPIYIFMLAFLVIGFTGAFDLLRLGNLANGAHLGGLIAGLVMGVLLGLRARLRTGNQP